MLKDTGPRVDTQLCKFGERNKFCFTYQLPQLLAPKHSKNPSRSRVRKKVEHLSCNPSNGALYLKETPQTFQVLSSHSFSKQQQQCSELKLPPPPSALPLQHQHSALHLRLQRLVLRLRHRHSALRLRTQCLARRLRPQRSGLKRRRLSAPDTGPRSSLPRSRLSLSNSNSNRVRFSNRPPRSASKRHRSLRRSPVLSPARN